MFETIVVGTDGSQGATAALRAAAAVAATNEGSVVHVVTAYHPMTAIELQQIAAELPQEFRSQLTTHFGAESRLDAARSVYRAAGVDAEYHEINNDPTDALLDAADEYGADLLVVGSRGEGAVKRALHGSVSTKVIHNAPCTVMVVRDDD